MKPPLETIDQAIADVTNALLGNDIELMQLRIIDAYALMCLLGALRDGSPDVIPVYENMDQHLIEYLPDGLTEYIDWFVSQPVKTEKKCKKPPKVKKS